MEVARTGFALPTPDEVEQLYALATSRPPQVEDADVAAVYAALYDLALDRADLVAVTAREVGELVGFGCGHRWHWQEQTDEWSRDLAERLGDDAAQLEGSFAVQLLADARLVGIPEEDYDRKINVNGSGISLGHPIGATGVMRLVSLVHEMRRSGLKLGLETICGGGGQAVAAVIARD